MAQNFPNSPTNGDTTVINGITYTYVSASSKWRATQVGGSGAGSGGSGTTTYATIGELPLTGNAAGDQAFVSGNNRLYIWNGAGWYNIALINTAPTITGGGAGSYDLAIDGTPTVITLTAADPEEVPITWTYSVTSGSLTNGGGATATVSQADNVFTITPTTTEAYAGTFSLTFTASDGVNIATDVNSFTLDFVTIIQDSNYTTLLITTSPTAQNNGINDLTDLTSTYTFTGDPSGLSNWSPFKSGGYSVYFDSSGNDHIEIDMSTVGVYAGDFTFECWFYTENTAIAYQAILYQSPGNGTTGAWGLDLGASGDELRVFYSGSTSSATSVTIEENVWYHVALVRSGSNCTLYLDGVSVATFTNSDSFGSSSWTTRVGRNQFSSARDFEGYITDVRLVDGTAVYTSNFTPPTERLTAVANTVLLTCAANTFKDDSTNTHTITTAGNTKISGFIPYDYNEYNKDDNIGSYYQNGSNNFTTTTIIPSSNYTIEGWVYVDGTNAEGTLLAAHALSGGRSWLLRATSGYIGMSVSGQTSAGLAGNYLNRWTHFAWTWDGTTQKMYINGVMSASAAVSSFTGSSSPLSFGFNLDNAPSSWYYQGYATNIRFSNTIRYTTDFDPLTESKKFTSDANTVLLIDPSEDQSVIDKSMQETPISLVGDTAASTTQTKYAASSIYFDGTGDYINFADYKPQVNGDFTWEAWIYTSSANDSPIWDSRYPSDQANGFTVTAFSSTVIRVFTSGLLVSATVSNYLDSWTHVAFTRSGTTNRLFINGTLGATATASDNFDNTSALIGAGRYASSTNITDYFNGYIEDLRVTNGLARYTSNFTPPTGSLEG